MRRCAEARRGELQARIEIAQRDVDAAQHEWQHQHDMADDDHRIAARQAELRREDQKAETDREMRNHEWREQDHLQRRLEAELVAVEREREVRADHERDRGRPGGHDQTVMEAGLKSS